MLNHSLTHNRLVSLLLAFVTAACSSTANTLPLSPSPIVLATLPSKLATPTVLPAAGPAATATEIATPTAESSGLPGYQNVEFLPNNILLTTFPAPANVIQSLAFSAQGGGSYCQMTTSPTAPTASIRPEGILLCGYPINEQVIVELIRPDGSVFSLTILLSDPDPEYPSYAASAYCFDPVLLLQPGSYQVLVKSTQGIEAGNFRVEKASAPTVFFSRSIYKAYQCGGLIADSEPPSQIFYEGFLPGEKIQVVLYKPSGDVSGDVLAYVTTWTAQMDENGRLAQHIQSPVIPDEGEYLLVVQGQVKRQISGLLPGLEIEASAAIIFLTSKRQTNFMVEVTSVPMVEASNRFPGLANLIYVTHGTFAMGSTSSDPYSEQVERPQHSVYVSDFWIEQMEVSNSRYAICVAARSCMPPSDTTSTTHSDYYSNPAYANYPVVNVNYEQASAYCKWAGGRLPTEAEWEKVARGLEGRYYPWGTSAPTRDIANYGKIVGDTMPVDAYPAGATPLGVLNMGGNVWEWVADWFSPGYYASSPASDPTGPMTGKERVVRGGSWGTDPQFLRTTNRFSRDPNKGSPNVGFRCVTTTAP